MGKDNIPFDDNLILTAVTPGGRWKQMLYELNEKRIFKSVAFHYAKLQKWIMALLVLVIGACATLLVTPSLAYSPGYLLAVACLTAVVCIRLAVVFGHFVSAVETMGVMIRRYRHIIAEMSKVWPSDTSMKTDIIPLEDQETDQSFLI